MTERLYYTDSYLREFRGLVVARAGCVLYLDRTAFYPASGGQPFDFGTIAGVPVSEVIDEGSRIAHVTEAVVDGGEVECRIDWARRFDHMQQHTGQHLLSAVLMDLFAIPTVSFHLGQDISTIDLAVASVGSSQVNAAEARANEMVFENRSVRVSFEDAAYAADLRKPSDRKGTLRVVTIQDLDRSACGGTHVSATGEIGPILIRKLDKIRGITRVEFLCGSRAVRRARADFDALTRVAQSFSAGLDEAPALVAAHLENARNTEKQFRRIELELARYRGRELYETTAPDSTGTRRAVRSLDAGNMEDLRALAQSFTAQPKAVFLAAVHNPPSVLLSVSEDAGIDAGKALKAAVSETGGRGGGNPRLAQGSVPTAQALARVMCALAAG